MRAPSILPTTLATRRARARRRTALLAIAAAMVAVTAGAASVLALLPLAAMRAWQAGGRLVAVAVLGSGLCSAARLVDLRALAAWPAVLAGPWIVLLTAAVATAAAWASRGRETSHLLRTAAGLAFVTAPMSPVAGLLLAALLLVLARRPPRSRALPLAANDNAAGFHPALACHALPRVSYPPPRSARPSAYD